MQLILLLVYALLFINGTLSLYNEIRRRYAGKKFNVCRKMSYYTLGATNPNECWYNPDVDSYAHDIIKRYGYSFESYKVTSTDSYITSLFRIPRGKADGSSNDTNNRQPIFLLHGLATSSHNMVDIGKQCLAFALADAGYDVWLGNVRGTSYSLGHTNLTYRNPAYWKFSFHEMGKYDMPPTLELIFKETNGKKITFIGHSLAASVFHVFEAYHRELSKNYLAGAVLIAPLVYLTNLQPPLPELERFGNPLMILATLLGVKNTTTDAQQVLSYRRTLCQELPVMLQTCNNGLYLLFGLKSPNIPPHNIPLLLTHNPSGFSVRTLNHLLQISSNDGVFQEYDFGVGRNQEIYDDVFPREYDIQGCETPVVVFYGAGDWISTESDVKKLLSTIPKSKVKGKYKILANVWKHLDYFYGKNLNNLFYKPLLQSLKVFNNDSTAEEDSANKCDQKTKNNTADEILEILPNTNEASKTKDELSSTIITIPKTASINNFAKYGTPSTLLPNPKLITEANSKPTNIDDIATFITPPILLSNQKVLSSEIITKTTSDTTTINNLATFIPPTLFPNPVER